MRFLAFTRVWSLYMQHKFLSIRLQSTDHFITVFHDVHACVFISRFLLNKETVHYETSQQLPQVSRMIRSFTAPMLSEAANDYPTPPSSPAPPPPTSSPPPISQQASPPSISAPPPPPTGTMFPLAHSSPPLNSAPPPVPTSPRPMGPPTGLSGSAGTFTLQATPSQQHREDHHTDSRRHPNLTIVSDRPSQQKHLVNSYHTLESFQGSQYHVLEQPSKDSSDQDTPDTNKQTLIKSMESALSPSQPSQYHVLEHPQATPEPTLKKSLSAADSPKSSKMTYPYLITDLRNRSGQESPESPSHKSTNSSSEALSTEGVLNQNTYHILEQPPTRKQSKQPRLESSRSQMSCSEKPARHKLDSAQLHGSVPPSPAENPRGHVYNEVVAIAKSPKSKSSRSFTVRSNSVQSDGGQPQTPPHYHVLEINAEPQIHQYDVVDSRMAARRSGEVHELQHNEYNQLGIGHNPQHKDKSHVSVYNTIGIQ